MLPNHSIYLARVEVYLEERRGIIGQVSVGIQPEYPGAPIVIEVSMDQSRVVFRLSPEEAREFGRAFMDELPSPFDFHLTFIDELPVNGID